MKRFLYLLTLLIILGRTTAKAQETQTIPAPADKKEIELRPNSRDYGPVKRDNQNQRIEQQKNQALFLKVRPVIKQHQILKENKKLFKNEQRIFRSERRGASPQQRPLHR